MDALARSAAEDPAVARLRMALALARGDLRGAGKWVRDAAPMAERRDGALATTAVQAAANQADAVHWLRPDKATAHKAAPDPADAFARAVVQHRFGDPTTALADAQAALAVANRDGSPDDRVRANLLRARILMEARQFEQATAVLGELDAYTATDYRVAWMAAALYGKRGDAGPARQARQQASALAGERSLDVPPLL
ncbi:hypothetical protein ACIGII_04590 [Stenotrophomonas sp. NPDC077420]